MTTATATPARDRGLAAAFIGVAAVYMAVFLVPPLITVFTDDIGISHAQAGLLMSIYLAGYASASLITGPITHRIGAPATIVLGLALATVATLAFPLTTDLALWFALRGLVGLATALVYAPGITYVMRLLPIERGNTGVGFYFSGLSVGVTIVFLATPVLESALGWRAPFWIFGGAIGVSAIVFALLAWPTRSLGVHAAYDRTSGGIAGLTRNPAFLMISAALFAAMFVAYGIYTWIAPWLDEVGGFDTGQISLTLALAIAVGIPATLLAGWLSDRTGKPMLIAGIFVATGATLIVLAVGDQVSYALATTVAVVASFGVTGGLSPLFALPRTVVDAAMASVANGVATTIAITGAILSTFLGGLLIESTDGYAATMTVYALVTVATVLVLFPLAASRIRRDHEPVRRHEVRA